MDRNHILYRLSWAGIVAAIIAIVAFAGMAYAIVCENPWLEIMCDAIVFVTVVVMVVGLVSALISRKWGMAIIVLSGLVCSMIVGFFMSILIGAGQYHAPHNQEEVALSTNWADCYMDSLGNRILGTELPKGSWWTAGDYYYEVTQTGKTILLKGYSLHEGGMLTAFSRQGDSLHVTLPPEGYTTFAAEGCMVRWHEIGFNAAGDSILPKIELLVAYSKENTKLPIAVLQRFNGDELQYELNGIYALLAGTYRADDGSKWTFLPNGCLKLKSSDEPCPYKVELSYDMPTNIVTLPDGRHVALLLTASDRLKVKTARYDADEDVWIENTDDDILQTLEKEDRNTPKESLEQRLITRSMANYLEGSYAQILRDYPNLHNSLFPMGLLNAIILEQWAEEEQDYTDDDQEEDKG